VWTNYKAFLYTDTYIITPQKIYDLSQEQDEMLFDFQAVMGMMTQGQFIELHKVETPDGVLDIGKDNLKITDEEAKQKIKEVCGVDAREIDGVDIAERNLSIKKLRENGLSIRQISRITGISKGISYRARLSVNKAILAVRFHWETHLFLVCPAWAFTCR
jgi:hypothetical protein